MDYFNYTQNKLYAEDVSVAEIAERFGTPCYIYSRATIERHWHAFNDVFLGHDHLICYSVKANSNIAILNCLAQLGSGFDIVSGGELARVIKAGGDPAKTVFSGVGKTINDIRYALDAGIHCFNVESRAELERINEIASELDVQAPISIRVNPDVDSKSHPYISTGLKENKFGIHINEAVEIYQLADSLCHINVIGLDCHIGSQLTETSPFIAAADRLLALIDKLTAIGITLHHIDVGGGLGIVYHDEQPPLPSDYATALIEKLGDTDLKIVIEPGRAIVGNAGILVTQVEYLKHNDHKNFAIVDAGMNDLLRPALYQAWQKSIPVQVNDDAPDSVNYDVVGPVCETADFLGKDRSLSIKAGDLLAVRSSGAYGFTMSSNYNSRPRAAEVMVDGNNAHLIRERESIESLYAGEQLLP